jgi:hypothetical protein
MTTALSHEEYRRLEGFLGPREFDASSDEPLVRYLLTNFALLGTGLAAWTLVVAGLMWMLF